MSSSAQCGAVGSHCSAARLAVALVLVCCIVLVAITFDADKVEALLLWVQENKSHGSLLFLALYTGGVVLMLPAMVMAMASGAIFGIVGGGFLAWLGSSIGQIIAFVIGRYLLRDVVLSYLTAQFPKWTAVDKAMTTDGWKLVTLLRLSPIAPWNILNYALSVTSVPLASYSIASSLAILPYLILFVYFGSMARSLADIFTGTAGLDTKSTIGMGIISCGAIVGIVWYTTHISRQAVNNALLQHAGELPPELSMDEEVIDLLGASNAARELSLAEMGDVAQVPTIPVVEMTENAFGASTPTRGRQRSNAQLLQGSGASGNFVGAVLDDENSGLLGTKGARPLQASQLHSRSAHTSPRAASPNLNRWTQKSPFS